MIRQNLKGYQIGYKPEPIASLHYIRNKVSLNEFFAVIESLAKQYQRSLLVQAEKRCFQK
nr:MAG TPA: hypothetical protein [Caudoviricetes sp.]